jgi:hypothetical protein
MRYGESIVSPKNCSLALDEVELLEQNHDHEREMGFEPVLKLFVNVRFQEFSSCADDVIKVSGRIDVSF